MKYQILPRVDILKPANGSDCTNKGKSSSALYATLLVPESITEGLFEPIKLLGGLQEFNHDSIDPLTPVFILVRRNLFGYPYFHVEPFCFDDKKPWYMFGGNFISYSGNGFKSITGYPLPIHDRVE